MAGSGITQYPFGAQASANPIVWAGEPGSSETVLFWNQDLNNIVYLGYTPSISVGDLNTIPLQPNAQIPLSANRTIYAVAPSGTANLVVIPGGGTPFLGLTQGNGQLVIPSIRSPNFIHNVSGWSINKNGSAEFNNVTIRNGTVIGGVFLQYSSAIPALGNLVLAFAPMGAGTDSVGNNYPAGFNFGVWDGTGTLKQHFGIDVNGKLYLADNTGLTRIFLDPSLAAELVYDASGISLGHLTTSIASAAGNDSAGNPFLAGFGSYDNVFGNRAQLIAGALNIFSAVAQTVLLNSGGLTIGASTGPQIKAITGVNLSVAFTGTVVGYPTDVSSVSNLQQVYELPSNDAAETQPSIIGQVKITYTNGDVALATLVLSALTGNAHAGSFQMHVGVSNNGLKSGGTLTGNYSKSGTTLTLEPFSILDTASGSLKMFLTGVQMTDPTSTLLVSPAEPWHTLAIGNGWTGTVRYKLGPENRVFLDIQIDSTTATAIGFATLPAGYRPISTRYLAAGSSANVASSASPFVQVLATGVMNMGALHAFSTAGLWVAGGSFPLD